MCELIAVTNRHLCRENFLERISLLAACGVPKILLREKDLTAAEYESLAEAVLEICRNTKTTCTLHNFVDVALHLQAKSVHLPLHIAKAEEEKLSAFTDLGVSTHSMEQVKEAEALKASYVTYGHVFATDCKKDLPPRGLSSLEDITAGTALPVYAIGGIDRENIRQVYRAGAAGACIMSFAMQADEAAIRQLLEL